ncbi:MAG: PspA/IM30 family protein [Candidatus Riflebacteria bacterium]|nr:PspA/IM30 family protein [Candidatus Riflebacteria bacterium]
MGVFDRMKRIVKGNLNAFLDKVENPHKALEQAIADMQVELAKAQESLTQSLVDEKRMLRNLEKERAEADQWRTKAGQLLAAGKEDLAKEALVRHKTGKELVTAKERELADHRVMIGQLKTMLDEMKKKIEVAKLKKVELSTRLRAASTAGSVSSDSQIAGSEAFKEFDKFVSSVDEEETRSQVMRELSGEKLDDELLKAQATQKVDEADDELERLKREMGLTDKKPSGES